MTDRLSTHFTVAELASPDTGEAILQPGFIEELEGLREAWGRPMVVTSGARTPAYNRRVGGAPASLHLVGNPRFGSDCLAVDIRMVDGRARGRLVALAWSRGFSIGVGATFVHVDARATLLGEPQVMWGYA